MPRSDSDRPHPSLLERTPSSLAFGNAIELSFAADVVPKFCDQRQDTHYQLARPRGGVDAWVVNHLGLKLSDNVVEIDCGPGRVALLRRFSFEACFTRDMVESTDTLPVLLGIELWPVCCRNAT